MKSPAPWFAYAVLALVLAALVALAALGVLDVPNTARIVVGVVVAVLVLADRFKGGGFGGKSIPPSGGVGMGFLAYGASEIAAWLAGSG